MEMHSSIIKTRAQKLKFENCSTNTTLNITETKRVLDKWLHDVDLEAYFESFSTEISKSRSDILLIGPSSSQMFKCGDSYQILENATRLSLNLYNYVFLCVNNYAETKTNENINLNEYKFRTNAYGRGNHWSLLFLNRLHKTCYHFDSIYGLNSKSANDLANNIAPNLKFLEINTVQQSGSFECGVHVIVNTQILLNKLTNKYIDVFDQCIDSNKSTITSSNSSNFFNDDSGSFKLINNFKNKTTHIVGKKESSYMKVKHSKKTTKTDKQHATLPNFEIKCSNRFEILNDDSQTVKTHSIATNMSNDISNKLVDFKCNSDHVKKTVPKCNGNTTKHKIKILADSHGRSLRERFENICPTSFSVSNVFKPNGTSEHILKDSCSKGMTKNDFLVLICGTNDVDNPMFNLESFIITITHFLEQTKNTNVIISYIPFRYDKTHLNYKIHEMNRKIRILTLKYDHANYLSFHGFDRTCYSKQGLHFNFKGKTIMCKRLMEQFLRVSSLCPIQVVLTTQCSYTPNKFTACNQYNKYFLDKSFFQTRII